MQSEDNLRTNLVGIKLTSDELNDLIISSKNAGIDRCEYTRQALTEKMQRDNGDFMQRRKKELENELYQIEQSQKILEKKKEDSTNLTQKEIRALIEAKRMIENNPAFLQGRLNKFVNEFGKPYKITPPEFIKLMDIAEAQTILKQSKEIVA